MRHINITEQYREYTDKYFLRTRQILEAEGINPLVRYQCFARKGKVAKGVDEAVEFIKNAIKEAKEETGLNVEIDNPLQPLCVLSDINQDPREFIASIIYTGKGRGKLKPRKDEDAKSAAVYTLEEIAEMLDKPVWAFPHHTKILKIYLDKAKNGRKKK